MTICDSFGMVLVVRENNYIENIIYSSVRVASLSMCNLECVFFFFFYVQRNLIYNINSITITERDTMIKIRVEKKRGQTSIGFLKRLPEIPVLLVFHRRLERFIARHVDHAHVVPIMLSSHMRTYIRGFLRRVIAIRAAESR